jgi:uncharacterized membrane protein YcaP (DUF421 family)
MEFFISQEHLTAIQWSLRAIIAFLFLLITSKLMGQRLISQLRLFDVVIAFTIGNIIAHPLSDEQLGMRGSLITITVIVLLYGIGTYLTLKWEVWRRFVSPDPIPLIKKGTILYKNLSKARITVDYLLAELRKEKINEVEKIALALWEPGGTISIFLESPYQPLTPNDMNIATKPFSAALPIIKEGKMIDKTLQKIGKSKDWVETALRTQFNVSQSEVLLATIDEEENLKVFLYN